MTADIYSEPWMLQIRSLPVCLPETFRNLPGCGFLATCLRVCLRTCLRRRISLLTDLLTGTAYGVGLHHLQLVESDPRVAKAGIGQFHKEKCKENDMFLRRWPIP